MRNSELKVGLSQFCQIKLLPVLARKNSNIGLVGILK